jgi:plastocyanin
MIRTRRLLATATIGAFLLTGAAACGSSGGSDSSGDTAKTTVADSTDSGTDDTTADEPTDTSGTDEADCEATADSNNLSGDSVVLFAADQDQATEADITDDAKATISADGSSMDPAELQVEAGTIFGFIGEDGLGIDGVIIGCAGGQTLPPATTIGFVITEPGTYPVSLDVAGTELGTVVVS